MAEKTYSVTAQVRIPQVPNFLIMEDGHSLPLWAVSEKALEDIGKLWIEKLIARRAEQLKEATSTSTATYSK